MATTARSPAPEHSSTPSLNADDGAANSSPCIPFPTEPPMLSSCEHSTTKRLNGDGGRNGAEQRIARSFTPGSLLNDNSGRVKPSVPCPRRPRPEFRLDYCCCSSTIIVQTSRLVAADIALDAHDRSLGA
eukprot:scaffold33435_cov32-Tisochrysis_lutea.AAC.2